MEGDRLRPQPRAPETESAAFLHTFLYFDRCAVSPRNSVDDTGVNVKMCYVLSAFLFIFTFVLFIYLP